MFVEKELRTSFRGCHSITEEVNGIVAQSGITHGLCIISVPHNDAGLVITSFWDPRGLEDLLHEIDRSFPARLSYRYQKSPYSAAGHSKSALCGNTTTLMIQNGKLLLGLSQGLVFMEFDGPRNRRYHVQTVDAKQAAYFQKLSLQTTFMGMHDLTAAVQAEVRKSGIRTGICHVSMMHSTAGLFVCDKDTDAKQDVMTDIERMVPTRGDFLHTETASDAGGHVKTAFAGSQVTLAVAEGQLVLGEQQAVMFAEFDGPRPRSCTLGIYPDHNN